MEKQLRDIEKRVLRLRRLGMTYGAIGKDIGRTDNAARELYRKAVRKLRHPAYKAQLAAIQADNYITPPRCAGRGVG